MMLVRCTSCHALVGFGNNLTFGPDTELVCFECAGDQVFGSGKDGDLSARGAKPASSASGGTLPANPAAANSPERAHPSNGGGARFFGGTCKQCGANVMLPFEPPDDPYWLDTHSKYLCSSCYVRVGGEGE